ncbi:MAG: archease [Dehalococcoidia bacterium]
MTSKRAPFELLEHTADVGVIARGETLAEAFAHAAEGMFSVMVNLDGVREEEERSVAVEAHDWPSLLVAWLSELLYFCDVEGLVFKRFEIGEMEPYRLRGSAYGERIDRERHELGAGVKAVTRHMLEVGEEADGYRVQILLDI